MDVVFGIFLASWDILVESAPYVFFGFFAAGILKTYLPEQMVAKHLGGSDTASVLKAALFGIPLPLCSCGVIPAAIELRKQGASKGATSAFLVSVPETGVDSAAITWALLDPVMTIIRPCTAFFTAILTGLLINILPENLQQVSANEAEDSSCCCQSKSGGDLISQPTKSHLQRIRSGMAYAFGDLLGDIGKWLLLGIAAAGLIAYLVPGDFFIRYMNNEFLSLFIMLGVGIPLYICASASTPVAAALVLKGLSPGAALVFLLAGPATNAATITVIARYLGKYATLVYLFSIAICSLFFGWLTNRIYSWLDLDITEWVSDYGHATDSVFMQGLGVVLLLLILRSIFSR
ncbi:MAG: SO_0444 family Cu/Zn efflux transporter [Thermodesulfobacteriota bacterium]|nr:SO_0444 family Cu/Zn efflux transporter [Thermodesulfobacteriota bacterium]